MKVSGKETERGKIMRSSKWKRYVVIAIAFIIGAVCGGLVGALLPETYQAFRGLSFFVTLAVVSSGIVVICVRVLHIGDD